MDSYRFSMVAVVCCLRAALACGSDAPSAASVLNLSTDGGSVFLNLGKLSHEYHALWLRERCTEPWYVDQSTNQPLYDVHHEESDLRIRQAVTDHETVRVQFSDARECTLPLSILVQEVRNDDVSMQAGQFAWPKPVTWTQELVYPPVFNFDEAMDFDRGGQAHRTLQQLLTLGLVVLADAPRQAGVCTNVTQRLSTLRSTDWGDVFNVRTFPDQQAGASDNKTLKDLAYTPLPIGFHTDNPYRDPIPDFQLLHAIEHCEGRECQVRNLFVDGFAVAEQLRHEDPESFDLLTKVRCRFENNGGDNSTVVINHKPIIELSHDGTTVKAIQFSAKSGGYAPPLKPEILERFYQAKRRFSQLVHAEENRVTFPLFPGAMVMFDNKRILHSRTAVAASDGPRWLQGCYMNRDGLWTTFERLTRSLKEKPTLPSWRTLGEATAADLSSMGAEYRIAVDKQMVSTAKELLERQRGNLLGAPITLFEHGLQSGTRALRAGLSDDAIVTCLLHDIFETMVTKSHGEMAAAFLAPWVSPEYHWIMAHHEVFQGHYYFGKLDMDPDLRDQFAGNPNYNATIEWCNVCDAPSFDPDYPSLPLFAFDDVLERVFSRNAYWWNPHHPKAGAIGGQEGEKLATANRMKHCNSVWECEHPERNSVTE